MTDQNICFIDCETTSLRHDRRAWEIAVIARRPGKPDTEHQWFIYSNDLDLGNADPASLKIGRIYDRHPDFDSADDPFNSKATNESNALWQIEAVTRGAILMGSNPSFDAETLAARMRARSICPSWHYHLEDVPTLAKGWLYGAGKSLPETWKSDAISLACGLDPARYDRHTALGDCHWIRDLYDLVTTGKGPA